MSRYPWRIHYKFETEPNGRASTHEEYTDKFQMEPNGRAATHEEYKRLTETEPNGRATTHEEYIVSLKRIQTGEPLPMKNTL